MFRPFIGDDLTGCSTPPLEICSQAAQALLALAQAYDDLFTLKRVPGLMPYFVCTAGLFYLAMGDSGMAVQPVHLRAGGNGSQLRQSMTLEHGYIDAESRSSQNSSFIQMQAVAHAHLLLAKMCSTHPAAAAAEKMVCAQMSIPEDAGKGQT